MFYGSLQLIELLSWSEENEAKDNMTSEKQWRSATTKQNNASNSGEMANKIKTKHSRCKGSRKNVDKTKCYPLTLSVIKLFLLLPHFKSGCREENFLYNLIVLSLLLRPPLTFNFQDLISVL